MRENTSLSNEHIKILKEREKIANTKPNNRLSWNNIKANISRKINKL